tara:strand:- start:31 stop:330 length:300 start_codon:yes stop_codon:yes gene_type:complete
MSDVDEFATKYKNKIERDRYNYHNKYKLDDEFIKKRTIRSKEHYEKTKDARKEKYKNNPELAKSKSSYYYYKKKNKLDVFMAKYPDRVEILRAVGLKVV